MHIHLRNLSESFSALSFRPLGGSESTKTGIFDLFALAAAILDADDGELSAPELDVLRGCSRIEEFTSGVDNSPKRFPFGLCLAIGVGTAGSFADSKEGVDLYLARTLSSEISATAAGRSG